MFRYILLILLFLSFPRISFADVPLVDKEEIQLNIKIIEKSLEKGDVSGILSLLSPNASPNLKSEIEKNFEDKKIHFTSLINLKINQLSQVNSKYLELPLFFCKTKR